MITGLNRSFLTLLFCCALSTPLHAEELLSKIFRQLGDGANHDATYLERKYISFLDVPLSHSGRMSFLPPDTLVRQQRSPSRQTFTVIGQQVTIEKMSGQTAEKGSEIKQISLQTLPPLLIFAEAMRAIMLGDMARLQKYFSVSASGSVDRWVLTLSPLDKQMKALIDKVQFLGQSGVVTGIKTYEVDGDWSDMQLTPVAADHAR